jgi:uncharacterized protein
MTLRFGLKETTIQKICDVLARYPQVKKAVLYGSRAKGNYKKSSDIDLTLLGEEDLTLNIMYGIMGEFDNLLLPYTMDLSIFRDIKDEDVIAHIKRVGIPFYEKEKT